MADVNLDFDKVTPRMLIDFKEKTGTSLMSLVDESGEVDVDLSAIGEELIAGIIWIAMRTDGQPEATWDQALDVPFEDFAFGDDEDGEDGDGAEDPTSASSAN